MKYPNLFTPMNIGPVTIKNRLVMTAMCVGLAHHDGAVSGALAAYYEERAAGGTGLIITECTRVNETDAVAYPINASDVIGRLKQGGARFLPGRRLERICGGMLYLRRKDGVPEEIRADATVLALGVRSRGALEQACAGHYERRYSIGDAIRPGRIGNATRSAFERARALL